MISDQDQPRLTEEEMRAVGFRPDVSGYDAVECQYLNEQLALNLAGYKSLSQEWWLKAKEIHQRARSILRCCG